MIKDTLKVSGSVIDDYKRYEWSATYHTVERYMGDPLMDDTFQFADFVEEILVIDPDGTQMHEIDEMPKYIAVFVEEELIEYARDQYNEYVYDEEQKLQYQQDMYDDMRMEQMRMEGRL